MKQITHNVAQLTDEEKAHIRQATWFSYDSDAGLIFLGKGTWNCTNSLGAKAYLEQNGIP